MKRRIHDDGLSTISIPAARLALGGALGVLVCLGCLHVLSPEFDPAWRMVSEYANGRYAWLLSLLFACWGLSSLALAYAIRKQARTIAARIGLVVLVAAGIGEGMAAIFDLNQIALHNLAGLLGMGGLPVAAMLISINLGRIPARSPARGILLVSANATWVSVLVLVASFVLMVGTFMATGAPMPAQPPRVSPHGVIGLVGWTNRLLVVTYCIWVIVVAVEAISLGVRKTARTPAGAPFSLSA